MSETPGQYITTPAPLVKDPGACSCGWQFGREIVREKRDANGCRQVVRYLVLLGTGYQVYHIVTQCPGCGKRWAYGSAA